MHRFASEDHRACTPWIASHALVRMAAFLLGVLLLGSGAVGVAGASDGPWQGELEDRVDRPTGRTTNTVPRRDFSHVVTLREGVASKALVAEGFKPGGYRQVYVRVRNTGEKPLRVDLCGSHLEPRRSGSCQRLGLGPVVTPRGKRQGKRKPKKRTAPHPRPPDQPPGTVIIGLKAGEEKVVHLRTCCLDAGKPSPSSQTFKVASDPLPEVREDALRWWADHPTASQGLVNRAIWQSRPIHEVVPPDSEFAGERWRARGRSGVASHAGTTYVLRKGDLTAIDPDGIERFLGTEIDGVFPTDAATYAISWGDMPRTGLASAQEPPRELWRLVHTGDKPWAHVATIPADLAIHSLHAVPGGAILLITHRGLYRVDRTRGRLREVLLTKDVKSLSVRIDRKGQAVFTHRRPSEGGYMQGGALKGNKMPVCELWSLDPKTGAKKRERQMWHIDSLRTGPAGTYALSHGGKLRRLQGRNFRNVPGQETYERILHVGRKFIWLQQGYDRLVSVDKAGHPRQRRGPATGNLGRIGFDAHTDDAVWRKKTKYFRLSPAARSKPVEVAAAPAR